MPTDKREYILSRSAWNELADILWRSELQWGSLQRDEYEARFSNSFAILCASPEIGRTRDDLAKGLRSHPCGSHIVYYWITATEIEIAHILDQRQDPLRQAWDE